MCQYDFFSKFKGNKQLAADETDDADHQRNRHIPRRIYSSRTGRKAVLHPFEVTRFRGVLSGKSTLSKPLHSLFSPALRKTEHDKTFRLFIFCSSSE